MPPEPTRNDLGASTVEKENALDNWVNVEPLLLGKQVVLFLDYDGTLSPIVDQPEHAYMKEGMRPVLKEAASTFTTAIVTGRSKEKVYNFVQLDDVFYAGSHGFEIQGPIETPVHCQMAQSMRPFLEQAQRDLSALLAGVPGASLEDNKLAMSVHYRLVPPELVTGVFEVVEKYVSSRPELVLKHGKKVLEIRPKIDWDKGRAVLWILEALGLAEREDVFTLYLGDDLSDEDAFRALQSRPAGTGRGMGILVKERADNERPQDTHAQLSLRNPDEVQHFLQMLVSRLGPSQHQCRPWGSPSAGGRVTVGERQVEVAA